MENKRRKAIKILSVSGGAYGLLPTSWVKPIMTSVMLPAHAQTSETVPETDPSCDSISSSGLAGVTCNASDDGISFMLNPAGTGLSQTYKVSGGSVSPTIGTYGEVTTFELPAGSANGDEINITITDSDDSACQIVETIQEFSCVSPPDFSQTISLGASNINSNSVAPFSSLVAVFVGNNTAFPSNGSPIEIIVTAGSDLAVITHDSNETGSNSFAGGNAASNADWAFEDLGGSYKFTYTANSGIFAGNNFSIFSLTLTIPDPSLLTAGTMDITSVLVAGSGGDITVGNDSDSEFFVVN